MRIEYFEQLLWLLVIGSWVFGVVYGYWIDKSGLLLDLSKAVHVPSPTELNMWWQPLIYFTLSVIAVFILSQIFFGAGAAIFLFARGVYDSTLILKIEPTIRNWISSQISTHAFVVLFILLILVVNLPLCLWATHLGTKRAVYMWYRIRGKPIRPEIGATPILNLLLIIAFSFITGLFGAFIFSHI